MHIGQSFYSQPALSNRNSEPPTCNFKFSSGHILKSEKKQEKLKQFKSLKGHCVLYTENMYQFGPATLQGLKGHMWLVVPVLDSVSLKPKLPMTRQSKKFLR